MYQIHVYIYICVYYKEQGSKVIIKEGEIAERKDLELFHSLSSSPIPLCRRLKLINTSEKGNVQWRQ